MKKCPACAEEVQEAAVKCKHCGKTLVQPFWSFTGGALLLFFIFLAFSSQHSSPDTSTNTSVPQTFGEKYPNVYAFVDDFRNAIQRGVVTDRLKNLMSSDPNWTTQHVYEQGFGDTYIGKNGELAPAFQCVDRFIKEHAEDSSCEVAERVLISQNYLGSSEKQIDIKDSGNSASDVVQSAQATSDNTETNYFGSSQIQAGTPDNIRNGFLSGLVQNNSNNAVQSSQMISGNTETNDLANSYTVNVPNSQGGYTAIIITKSGNGYKGQKGEHYSEFPTVAQLQATYGLN